MKVIYNKKIVAHGLRNRDECMAFIAMYCAKESLHFENVSIERKADKEYIKCGEYEFVIMEER